MGMELQNQTAVVTGAGRGIGRAVALRLARAGATVVCAARTESQLKTVADRIRADGGAALIHPTDISDERSVDRLFSFVEAQTGGLDILVNNAGIGVFGPLADCATADFDRVMAVNARGTFLCCRSAVRLMRRRSRGAIITISSVVGFKGYANQAAYTASKHAIMGLTKSLAREEQQHGIRVAALLPGGVDTNLAGDARPDLDRSVLMAPDDVAQAVMYLLSVPERAAVDEIYIRRGSSTPFG